MLLYLLFFALFVDAALPYRTWLCNEQKCVKGSTLDPSTAISVGECKLTCLPFAGLWPQPNGDFTFESDLITVDPKNVGFSSNSELPAETARVLSEAQKVFLSRHHGQNERTYDTNGILINIDIANPEETYYKTGVDESYSLDLSRSTFGEEKQVNVDIQANTFLGARHALETLAQLIVYDEIHHRFRTLSKVSISDKPVFQYRGMHLDTARSYFSVESILRVIDGMAQNKLNSLHWHITDTHSFPYVSAAYPQMAREGAYSDEKVYTPESIRNVVEYARVRGVRVTPELDAPAHVGEGWDALGDDLITCFRWEPWTQYCVEPPCGQFDPTNDRVYDILKTIYQEWSDLFKSDLFHLGGDEINFNCWKSTERIVKWMQNNNLTIDDNGFIKLWERYQSKSLDALRASQPNAIPFIWTSTLTETGRADKSLDPGTYVIQIWTKKDDISIKNLIDQKFKIIFTNYDELYLDCGAGAWIGGPGQNWCSPFKGWQTVYGHDPYAIVTSLGVNLTDEVKSQILGSESALWTEQVDEQQVEGRLFPRAAALAERLWSNPTTPWSAAQYRINNHRERLVRNGVRAEQFQPTWCFHNDGFCGEGV